MIFLRARDVPVDLIEFFEPIENDKCKDVFRISSTPSKLKHFAMMPIPLVERCILTGPSKVCGACGAPWAPVVEREPGFQAKRQHEDGLRGRRTGGALDSDYRGIGYSRCEQTGIRATCACAAPPVPPLVLDPFLGAGTSAGVATAMGRRWLGCELSPAYAALVTARIAEVDEWFARHRSGG